MCTPRVGIEVGVGAGGRLLGGNDILLEKMSSVNYVIQIK